MNLPSNERAEMLREIYKRHVQHPTGNWKEASVAYVPADMAGLVREAMDFMGSLVDIEEPNSKGGLTRLYSHGYYHHIGA